jgi:hypothetical protein
VAADPPDSLDNGAEDVPPPAVDDFVVGGQVDETQIPAMDVLDDTAGEPAVGGGEIVSAEGDGLGDGLAHEGDVASGEDSGGLGDQDAVMPEDLPDSTLQEDIVEIG